MKVILVNGSPHQKGCTYTALCEIATVLNDCGTETEIFWTGIRPLSGCLGCGGCRKDKSKCVIDDCVNEFLQIAADADAFVFGSPVHFAAASGTLTSFMDRAFYGRSKLFGGKPAAAIVSCRRGGASAAFDQLNKYFSISGMPIVSSQYWNSVHGNSPEEVRRDEEGMQTMRTLAKNLFWLTRCIEEGKKAGLAFPEREPWTATNFIR